MWIVAVFIVEPAMPDIIRHNEAYGPFLNREDAEAYKAYIFGKSQYRGNWVLILPLCPFNP